MRAETSSLLGKNSAMHSACSMEDLNSGVGQWVA